MLINENIEIMGMKLDQWTNKSCVANFGIGDDWATLYDIQSNEESKGHATELLKKAGDQRNTAVPKGHRLSARPQG